MEQVFGKYFFEGTDLKSTGEFYNFIDNKGTYIFEVLRVISGVPLFIDEHIKRLSNSVLKSGIKLVVDFAAIRGSVFSLIKENQTNVGNIKIVLRIYNKEIQSWHFLTAYRYPQESDYQHGVSLGILRAERLNPEAKTIQSNVRETANKFIAKHNLYEVLLVDKQGFIREGSRSNVFFIKDNYLVTAPLKLVLNGITRQKVIDVIKLLGFQFIERLVTFDELVDFDCIFLTGTSPKVLPVRKVDNFYFDTNNHICLEIRKQFDLLIEQYILDRK